MAWRNIKSMVMKNTLNSIKNMKWKSTHNTIVAWDNILITHKDILVIHWVHKGMAWDINHPTEFLSTQSTIIGRVTATVQITNSHQTLLNLNHKQKRLTSIFKSTSEMKFL